MLWFNNNTILGKLLCKANMANIKEDNEYVLHGPNISTPIPKHTMGRELHSSLLKAPAESIAMIDAFTNEKLTFKAFLQKSVNLAETLRRLGYEEQNTVYSVSSENSLNFFVPVLAAFFNGSIMAPLNHSYTPSELEHSLNISTPKIIFCSKAVAQKFIDLKSQKLPYIEKIIVLDNNVAGIHGGVQTMDEFVQETLGSKNMDVDVFQPVDGDNSKMAALIMCSSGTTGLPKGVAQSHLNLMVRLIHSRCPLYEDPIPSKSILGLLPFFHGYGLLISLMAMANLNTTICLRRFDEDVFLKSIQDYKIRTLSVAPPLAIFLAKTPKIEQYDLSCIEGAVCGAAPLSKSTEEELKRRLKIPSMRQGYGLTETTLAVTIVEKDVQKPGSCGRVIAYMSCKIRDTETGKSLGPRQVGEFCIKGPMVMMGYYKNEKATREMFTSDGWLKTGDLGYYDEDGYFYVIDRLKELIKYKGFQVAPAELEAILINHKKIDDVGVVGLPDELVGEKPLAFVVKRKGVDISEEEIKKFVADVVSPQKWLSGGVIFVDSIPKNPSGKILRKELRELLKKYINNKIKSKL